MTQRNVLRRLFAWAHRTWTGGARPDTEGRNIEAADQRTYDSWDHS